MAKPAWNGLREFWECRAGGQTAKAMSASKFWNISMLDSPGSERTACQEGMCSESSEPLAGTSRFHRIAAYTRCLRCAGAPRRPASGSELSLHIPSWHAVLSDAGESNSNMFQNFDADRAFAV